MPTTYLDELKDLVLLHARAQSIPPEHCARLLAGITAEAGPEPTSWPQVWSRAGEVFSRNGADLQACRCFNMARFPYVDGPDRAAAMRRCHESFQRWAWKQGYERIVVEIGGQRVPLWFSAPDHRRPLLVVMGGIVSIKEQWGQLLPAAGRLGMAVAVAEMPGVGENPLTYDAESWRIFPALLDGLSVRADTDRAYLLALSFSGHLAMRAATRDQRIRGIASVGPPVSEFFRDRQWWAKLPRTTTRTLAHLTGVAEAELADHVTDWGLTGAELSALSIPVHSVASARDEIIPPADVDLLRTGVAGARIAVHDDVHGSPRHLVATKLWSMASILTMRGTGIAPRALGPVLSVLEADRSRR